MAIPGGLSQTLCFNGLGCLTTPKGTVETVELFGICLTFKTVYYCEMTIQTIEMLAYLGMALLCMAAAIGAYYTDMPVLPWVLTLLSGVFIGLIIDRKKSHENSDG